MTRILRKLLSLPGYQKKLLAEAVIFLYITKLLLLFLPVKTVMKITLSSKKANRQPDPNLLRQIKWVLYCTDRLSFWKNRCLVQSIAGRWMLQWRGIASQVIFGIKHDDAKKVVAHAWLKAGDFDLVDDGTKYLKLNSY